jgi:5,10-methylenetetrahydromethanopterin reductase
LLGSWGPKTIRACVDHISEIKIGGTANPGVIPQMKRAIAEAAARIERDPAEIGLALGAVTVVALDGEAARAQARREAALYLSIIAELDQSLEIEPELLQRIKAATAVYDYDEVARNISDDLLRRLAFAGTPDQVAAQASELFEAGAQRVEFGTPHGLNEEEGLRLLGEQVLPLITGN